MKATMKLPKTKKGWFCLSLIIIDLILGCWPGILLVNNQSIVFGMPVMMVWAILIILLTTAILLTFNQLIKEEA